MTDDGLSIDVTQLKGLARDLRKVNPVLQKEFLKTLGHAGDVVAEAARANASFSTRIPGSIKVRRRGVSVRVQAGGGKAPHAAAFEHDGKPGTFRHPVFGNYDVWVSQQSHPFLQPALESNVLPLERAVIGAVDLAFHSVGFND